MSTVESLGQHNAYVPEVGEYLPEEREWWDRKPHLILSPNTIDLGDVDDDRVEQFAVARSQLHAELIPRFDSVSEERVKGMSVDDPQVVIRSVFLGDPKVSFDDLASQTDEDNFRAVARKIVPELLDPFKLRESKRLTGDAAHRNFINAVHYDASQWRINELNDKQKVWLAQRFMAADFAFKHLFIGVDPERTDDPIESIELASLEGGHPVFYPDDIKMDFNEHARRLRGFGSVQGSPEIPLSSETISKEDWLNSEAVNRLIDLGTFIGKHELVARNVEPKDLTDSRTKLGYVRHFSSMKRGAEGAFRMYDPELGVDVVTGTGSAGVVKTNLGPADLVPFRIDEDGIYRLTIEGIPPIRESVEAHEFSAPQHKLSEEFKVEAEGKRVAPIRWTIHLHQEVDENSLDRPVIAQDVDDVPPTGCGVDLMDVISEDLQRQALEEWEASGRTLPYAILKIPNHGITIVGFWTEDDSLEAFQGDYESGDLRFKYPIEQE